MQGTSIPPRLVAANKAFAEGRKGDALDLIMAELGEAPESPAKVYKVLIANLLSLRRIDDAAHWASLATDRAPNDPEIHNFTGVVLREQGRLTNAVAAFDRALMFDPKHRGALINKGQTLITLKDGRGAEAIFTSLLQSEPRSALLHRSLGKAFWVQERLESAEASLRQAVSCDPSYVDGWLDLSAMIVDRGDPLESLELLDRATSALPEDARLAEAKAIMFRRAGIADRAWPYLQSVAAKFSSLGWFQHEVGQLKSAYDRQAANAHFRSAVERDPANVQFQIALIDNLARTRGVDEGAYIDEAYQRLQRLAPQARHRWSRTAAQIFTQVADYDSVRALGGFDQLGREWAGSDHHSALLRQMSRIESGDDRIELLDQHRLWGRKAMDRAHRHPISRPPAPAPRSKIRLGFMSSDLREHVVTQFVRPLFDFADRERFEIYCYSWYQTPKPGPVQTEIAALVDMFRWHPFISDHDAAQLIANDQLDILFELGGSTHMNKIEVMAWKPARLCASWLGYPHSAGLPTIDYLLVDPFLNPPDPQLLIEKPLVMPRSWIAMSEQAFPDHHAIAPLAPVRRTGRISFGTANDPYKYNKAMLRIWGRVMARIPDSRFIFVRPEGSSLTFARNIRACFEAEGVAGDRIEFRAVRGDHMRHYNDIDIALDTFPQTGGTTTCEALWMGVPTVTLVGEALFERLSYSILNNAGLGDLCAATADSFVEVASALAADTDRLQSLRTGLRDTLRASPLGQTRQFAKDFYDLVARIVEGEADAPPLSSTITPP